MPYIPSCLPVISTPTNCVAVHKPQFPERRQLIDSCALLAAPSISKTPTSAVADVTAPGVANTARPRSLADLRSI